MKFRSTLFLLIAFIALLVFVLVVEFPEEGETTDYLVNNPPYEVEKIEFETGETTVVMEKQNDEEWMITSPLNAPADKNEVEKLASDMSELTYEKIVETESPDLDKYGIPSQKIRLYYQDKKEPVAIHIGEKNPLDNTYFAKLGHENRVALLPSRLHTALEKKLADFRKKDIFQFDTEKAESLSLTTPEFSWQAEKRSGEWYMTGPVESMADKTAVQQILDSLSGLKAEEFISEDKSEEEMQNFGLENPPYLAGLNIPGENIKLNFHFNQMDEELYATTDKSAKIVTVADTILNQLDKPVSSLREKSIADFYTWEVTGVNIESRELTLSAVKDKENAWHLDALEGPEADTQKIEDFLRKLSYLEAAEFIDPPWDAGRYGLSGEIRKISIATSPDEKEEPEIVTLLIGKEDEENNQVIIKNQRFDYLFKTDSAFLQNYPSKREEWIQKEAESEKEK